MNKYYIFLLTTLHFITISAFTQEQRIADSLAKIYQQDTLVDTAKYQLLKDLSFNEVKDLKKGLLYAEELIRLSQRFRNNKYLRAGYFLKGSKEMLLGNLDQALSAMLRSAELAKQLNNSTAEAESYGSIADVYSTARNYPNASLYYNKAVTILREAKDSIGLASVLLNAGDEFFKTKNYDSALLYCRESQVIFNKLNYLAGRGYSIGNIGMVYAKTGKNDYAEKNLKEAIRILEKSQDYQPVCDYLISLADVYLNRRNVQKALNFALESLHLAEQYKLNQQVSNANLKLSEIYEKLSDANNSLQYYKSYIVYRDSINNITSVQKMADLRTAYEVSQKQVEVNTLNQQKRNQKNGLISLGLILLLAIVILIILLKNNQYKQKAYAILNRQKQETDEQKFNAEAALKELQITQTQLIQSEKMASLGELTAGIAHEIQNPLNFVNNFSEVNTELINELQNEIKIGNAEEAFAISNDIKENEQKINHHGKRADTIVKGMLQHSRANSGKKEPTDINALADEYLRLSYHGLRAKDKSFNAAIETNFEESIAKIEVIPQDIGRVLLNLFNNAFYAVNEKKKQFDGSFEPVVSVSTERSGDKVQISVRDNSIGIPQKAVDKIFQPFFTTKPTGQGTGLGLSLSYDIIKAHGGELKVETKEGEYTQFTIILSNFYQP